MKNGPCELCIIKVICTVLCREKVEQVCDKVVERKRRERSDFSKRGGVLLWDFVDELNKEGIEVTQYDGDKIEVKNWTVTVKGETTSI